MEAWICIWRRAWVYRVMVVKPIFARGEKIQRVSSKCEIRLLDLPFYTLQQQTMGKGKRSHTISSAPAITSLVPSIPLRSSGDLVLSLAPTHFLSRPSIVNQSSPKSITSPVLPPRLRWTPQRQPKREYDDLAHKMESAPLLILISTYLNWFVLILLGHLRDTTGKIFKRKEYQHLKVSEVCPCPQVSCMRMCVLMPW